MSDINDRSELENYTYNKYAKSNDFNANRRFKIRIKNNGCPLS